MFSANTKVKIQSFGRFLSNMVMPNIGAFIAWGIITALFIPKGWIPNETLAKLVGPMITYLLPLLIGYTGGRLVGSDRGGVVGAITTMGVIVGTDIPMFLGAMICGPIGGYCIKKFDSLVEGKIKSGFEMLVNNFSAGIMGMLLAIIAFLLIGPAVIFLSDILATGVQFLVNNNLLPLTSIIVEPAKILFLNNAINHGIFSPLGLQQSQELGKSIFFLIEANPGPGLGVLLAYLFFGRGSARQTAGGASIIHFFGGIHEIYFPYVLMNPRLIIAVILGGMTGVFVLSLFNAGVVSPASPGSIIAILLLTPNVSNGIGIVCAIFGACLVSFLVSAFILKTQKEVDDNIEQATAQMHSLKGSQNQISRDNNKLVAQDTLYVACDAGMGSSAMGATMLRKKVQEVGLNLQVTNKAINDLPQNAKLVITHKDLTERARKRVPHAQHLSLTNFLDNPFYDHLVEQLLQQGLANLNQDTAQTKTEQVTTEPTTVFSLTEKQIFLGLQAENKEQAIRFAGERLVEFGFVRPEYIDAMFEREKLVSTYLGEGVAVPHGTAQAKEAVLKTGIVVCQYPEGVRFNDEEDGIAKLVIAIAARNNEHIQVLTTITTALDDEEAIHTLSTTSDVKQVLALLGASHFN